MSDCAESVEQLRQSSPEQLTTTYGWEERFEGPVSAVMKSLNERIGQGVHEALLEEFEGSDWEHALVVGLKALFPNY